MKLRKIKNTFDFSHLPLEEQYKLVLLQENEISNLISKYKNGLRDIISHSYAYIDGKKITRKYATKIAEYLQHLREEQERCISLRLQIALEIKRKYEDSNLLGGCIK